jgi:uncharacterized membrane protein
MVAFGELLMVAVLAVTTVALPIAIVVLLVRAVRRPAPDPRATLAERLASGEITREEFDTAMRALGSGEAPRSG